MANVHAALGVLTMVVVAGCGGARTADVATTEAPLTAEAGAVAEGCGGDASFVDASAADAPVEIDPVGCENGYCEPDNRLQLTVCRAGYHVDVYAVCGLGGEAACCQPNR